MTDQTHRQQRYTDGKWVPETRSVLSTIGECKLDLWQQPPHTCRSGCNSHGGLAPRGPAKARSSRNVLTGRQECNPTRPSGSQSGIVSRASAWHVPSKLFPRRSPKKAKRCVHTDTCTHVFTEAPFASRGAREPSKHPLAGECTEHTWARTGDREAGDQDGASGHVASRSQH